MDKILLSIEVFASIDRSMTRINKKNLSPKERQALYRRMVDTLWSAGTKQKFHNALSDLLTESEEIMLAKRLSIVFLLNQGMSGYKVHQLLDVSESTVHYMEKKRDAGVYEHLQKLFCKKKEKEDMWMFIELLSRGGLPELGKGRWKSLSKYSY